MKSSIQAMFVLISSPSRRLGTITGVKPLKERKKERKKSE